MTFTKKDLEFLKRIGIDATPTFADDRMELARRIAEHAPPGLPPIPDGHYRIRCSDGGLWDIPATNIDLARKTDPTLQILNPDDYWG